MRQICNAYNMPVYRFSVAALWALLLVSSTFGQPAASETRKLKFNKTLNWQIHTFDSHAYRFALRQGQGLSVEVEEMDVNLKVEIWEGRNNKLLAMADLGSSFERETLSFVAAQSGEFVLRVSEAEKESGRGRYRLRAHLFNAVTEKERMRIEAEQLLRDAVALQKEGMPDRIREAISKRQQALDVWRSLGDRYWESHTLRKLGESHYSLFEFGKATTYINQSLLIIRELGDRKTEAAALQVLGAIYMAMGDRDQANAYFHEACSLLKQERNRLGEAVLLFWIGNNKNQQSDQAKALEYFNQALPIAQEEQNQGLQAAILWGLGQIANAQNEKSKAVEHYNSALKLWRAVKDGNGEGLAQQYLATSYVSQGQAQKALDHFSQALRLFKSAKNRVQEGLTFLDMSDAYIKLGKDKDSIEAMKQALVPFQEFKHRPLEITLLGLIAAEYNLIGEYKEAIKYAEMAIAVEEVVPEGTSDAQRKKQETQMIQSKGLDQQAIGGAYYNLGDYEKALLHYNHALALFEKIEGPSAKRLASTTLSSIAQIYGDRHEWDKALENYNRSLSIAEEIDNKADIARRRNSLGNVCKAIGETRKSLEHYEHSLRVVRSIQNKERMEKRSEAGTLNNLGTMSLFFGEPQKALDYHRQALSIWQELNDLEFSDELAATIKNIAAVHSFQGEKRKALELLTQALGFFRQAPPRVRILARNRSAEAHLINHMGVIRSHLGESKQALEAYNEALKASIDAKDKDLEVAALNNLGLLYSKFGEPRKALQTLQQSLQICRAIKSRDSEITVLNNIGYVYSDLGNPQEALKNYKLAMTIAQEVGSPETMATTLGNMGVEYQSLGEPEKAFDYFNQALAIRQKIGDKSGESISITNLANYYSGIGERGKALDYYEKAMAIVESAGDKSYKIIILGNIAYEHLELGENQKALEYREKSLQLSRETGEKRGQINSLFGLATIYRVLGEKEKNPAHFQRSLEYSQQALQLTRDGEDKISEAGTLSGIGRVYVEMNEPAKALQFLTEALQLARQYQNKYLESATRFVLGKLHEKTGAPEKAIEEYQQDFLFTRAVGDKDSQAKALKGLMSAWKMRGNTQLAIFYGKQSVNQYQALRSSIRNLQKGTQETYREKITDVYRELANLLITEDRLLEAQAVLDLLKEAEFKPLTRSSTDTALTLPYSQTEEKIMEVIDRLASSQLEFDNLQLKPKLSESESRRLSELQEFIVKTNEALSASIKELGSAAPDVEPILSKKYADNIQSRLRRLGAGTVALYTVVGKTRAGKSTAASETEKNNMGWIILFMPGFRKAYPIDTSEFEQTVFQFRQSLRSVREDPRPLAQKLYRKLFLQTSARQKTTLADDLEAYLNKYKDVTLMWSLDGFLRYVPIAALHDGKQYLVEKYRNVVFNTKSRDHLSDAPRAHWEVLGFGVSEARKVRLPDGNTFDFPAIAGAETELQSLVKEKDNPQDTEGILPGSIRMNQHFTKQSLFEVALVNPAVIHIASHFLFDPVNPQLSFLLLGDGNRLDATEFQNFPTFFEVDLLVLSACDTATGEAAKSSADFDLANGRETEGFAHRAQELGAKSVMASLWQVSDEGTKELMLKFYQIRQANPPLPKGEALRQAQLALLKGNYKAGEIPQWQRGVRVVADSSGNQSPPFQYDEKAPYAHPHFWSPFVLIGNWR